MAFSRNACIFVLSLAFSCCTADPISSIELTRDNFDSEINGKNTLVIFYSPRQVHRMYTQMYSQFSLDLLTIQFIQCSMQCDVALVNDDDPTDFFFTMK